MALRTRAAVLTARDTPLEVRELTLSPPGPGEVLVKMERAGLCRSDINALTGHTRYEMPLVLGHEGVGTVVETGPGVHDLGRGQRVALSWAAYCGRCYFCQRGETELCSAVAWPRGRGRLPDGTTRFRECGGRDGGGEVYHFNGVSSFSEYTVVYRTGCVPVPDGVSAETASRAGCPVVTAFGAVFRTAGAFSGEGVSALVVGGGSVGRAVVEALRLRGARSVILVESERERWDKDGVNYFTETIEPEEILGLTGGVGVDICFDCVATEETTRRSLGAVRRGGTMVMVGSPHPLMDITLPAVDFHLEKRLMGSLYGSSNPREAIPWILGLEERGLIRLDPSSDAAYGLEDINKAISALEGGRRRVAVTFE